MILLLLPLLSLRGKPKVITRAKELVAFRQYAEAKKLIESMKTLDTTAILVKAECELELGLTTACKESCESIISSSKAQDILLELHIRTGKYSEAKDLANLYQKTEKLAIINHLIELSDARESNIDHLLEMSPLDPSLVILKAEQDWQNRDFTDMKKLSDRLSAMFPDNDTIIYRLDAMNMCNMNLTKFPEIKDLSVYVLNESNPKVVLEYITTLTNTAESSCPALSKFTNFTKLATARYHRLTENYNTSRDIFHFLWDSMKKDSSYLHEKALFHLAVHEYDEAISIFSGLGNENWLSQARVMKRRSRSIDWYAFLGLDRDKGASLEEIKAAYHKIAKKWHPDLFKDKEKRQEAERLMKRVNCAYDILTDPKLKDAYDKMDTESEKPQEFNRYDEFMAQIPFDDEDEERVGPIQITIEV